MSCALHGPAETRESLLRGLKNWDDQESWRQFFDTYWRLLLSIALKAGLSEQEAEDAVQETIISVAKTMPNFKYDRAKCSFKTWLWHLAQKRIADQFRKRDPADRARARTATAERLPDPATPDLDALWEQEWKEAVFNAALRRIRTKASVNQYQMFDFYVLKNWPVSKVACALKVSAPQIYLAKHRVMGLIKREAALLEKKGFNAD